MPQTGIFADSDEPQNRPATLKSDTTVHEVIARKYRPKNFSELVGQEHVWKGLAGAIHANRVGHAYLFTGARGTGKTTTARIFAKCLNCLNSPGPTITPCQELPDEQKCDSCRSIVLGSDIDVIEMDAASTNGVDDVRDLRQNAIVRPTRARYKIYILDEAHMMSKSAFNALLKTLEEPPGHVKFIFCTTEAEKIPITILSRCQRFDFAHVQAAKITERLQLIAEAEQVQVEPAALALLARRAGGSMRDSQSLLEQLLSFGSTTVTANDVHQMLGTTDGSRLLQVLAAVVARDTPRALHEFATALEAGADLGTLWDQLLGQLRDMLMLAVGCDPELLLHTLPGDVATVLELTNQVGLEGIMAWMQIVDQTLARLRYLSQPRTLAELALVRMCRTGELQAVAQLVSALRQGNVGQLTLQVAGSALPVTPVATASANITAAVAPPELKKNDLTIEHSSTPVVTPSLVATKPATAADSPVIAEQPANSFPAIDNSAPTDDAATPGLTTTTIASTSVEPAAQQPGVSTTNWNLASLRQLWHDLLAESAELAAENARVATLSIPELESPNASLLLDTANSAPITLVLSYPKRYNFNKQFCERPGTMASIETALTTRIGRQVKFQLILSSQSEPETPTNLPAPKPVEQRQKQQARLAHPMVKKVIEQFSAQVLRIEEPTEITS